MVHDESGARVPHAQVTVVSPWSGFERQQESGADGTFIATNVPFGDYEVQAIAGGMESARVRVKVRSNLPVRTDLQTRVRRVGDKVEVHDRAPTVDVSHTGVQVERGAILRTPRQENGTLAALIATTPGWGTEDNGLIHVRGVDDGVLYVRDGIPLSDRVDALSGNGFDPELIRSFTVMTGNIPAEFGGRAGAVVTMQPKSALGAPMSGTVQSGIGGFGERHAGAEVSVPVRDSLGLLVGVTSMESNRFLDPVAADNFHNSGTTTGGVARLDWKAKSRDLINLEVNAAGRNFDVPNDELQQLAGQSQRQHLEDVEIAAGWQRVWSAATVTNVAYFDRHYGSNLQGSPFDVPLWTQGERNHSRRGALADVTRALGKHILKAGVEADWISIREQLQLGVTDPSVAADQGIVDSVLQFTREAPFSFADRAVGTQMGVFVQDQFFPVPRLSIMAGVRFDRSTLPVTDHGISPRIGAVYNFTKTRTALRGSYNVFYTPPQIENLLLATSAAARELSPFVDETGGGATILPEKSHLWEAGVTQELGRGLRLDIAQWWRGGTNVGDPNVFLNTTMIFPNSVAKEYARGTDVRVDYRTQHGVTAYASYSNQIVKQTGPITGGLFLDDDVIDIGPGVQFVPDHDQRNVGAIGVMYYHARSGFWVTFAGRHESGVPLELDRDALQALANSPLGAYVNIARARVNPWTTLDLSGGVDLRREKEMRVSLQAGVLNLTNESYVFNLSNPFSGTHFAPPRTLQMSVKFSFGKPTPITVK